MPLIIAGILGASALSGALSNRTKTTTTNTNTTQNYSNQSSSTPNLTPQQQSIYDILVKQAKDRLGGMAPGLQGYQATGLSNINAASNASASNLQNKLAAMGLSGSPVAGNAATQLELARSGQSATFNNSLPLLQNNLQLQNLGVAGDIFRLPGVGQNTASSGTSTGTGTTTGTTSGNMLGGAFGSVGSMLGYLAGTGQLGGTSQAGIASTPPTNYGSPPSGPIATAAPSMTMPPWLMQAMWGVNPNAGGT